MLYIACILYRTSNFISNIYFIYRFSLFNYKIFFDKSSETCTNSYFYWSKNFSIILFNIL